MFDLVIRGGLIVDGTGAAPVSGDVAVADGRIVDVGDLSGQAAARTIDADGAVVTPGFLDCHTHYDGQVTWDDALEGSAANGVTTVVTGNCGVGFAPVRPNQWSELIDLMEGVEDIPGTALYEGMPWGEWESFPEYLKVLDGRNWSVDVATLIPHAPLRYYVMGERSFSADRPAQIPTHEDLDEMCTLVTEAARAGALGFSTSRILFHRSASGAHVPGTFALESELLALAHAAAKGGSALLQAIPATGKASIPGIDSDDGSIADEIRLLGRISRAAGVRATYTTAQHAGEPDAWRDLLSIAAEENALGGQLNPMVLPRGATVLTTLRGYHLFMLRPTFQRLVGLPHEALVEAMRKPDVRQAILSESDVNRGRPGSMLNVLPPLFENSFGRTFPLSYPLDYEPVLEHSIARRAAAQGVSPAELLYDFLLENGGRSIGMLLAANYVNGDLAVCREMLSDPNTVSGLSDAGAHVNFVCDMSVPTFHLTHWVKNRTRGERLPVEQVVRKITGDPARVFGLGDRGRLTPGRRADINVIDLDRLEILSPQLHYDLPAGGSRFLQPARGYAATVVAGSVTRQDDHDTGERPGRLARPAAAING